MTQHIAPQIITPPNKLRHKVSGHGDMDDDMRKKINITMRKHELHYNKHALEQLDLLNQYVRDLSRFFGSKKTDSILQHIYYISHSMRGEGGCYGFPLITQVAHSLCEFVEVLDDVHHKKLITIIETHCQTLNIILKKNIKQDGDKVGQEISFRLNAIVEKYLKEHGLYISS